MTTAATALEQARAIFDNAPNDPDWSAIPAIAAALMDARADGMEYAAECELAAQMGSIDTNAYQSPEDIRAEAAKLRGEGT